MRLLAPLGRLCFAIIFVYGGIGHFTKAEIGYAASAGVPMANVAVPVSGVISIIGGLLILLGLYARVGALLIVIFLVPVTVKMHRFWGLTDPQAVQMQQVQFLKNLSMLGGALLIAYFGAGPFSFDHIRARKTSAQRVMKP